MGMCCEKEKEYSDWSMKCRVPRQEVDQRKLVERFRKKTVSRVD